jgi:alpha-D-ribose 1-methylphosphonate 5-triphosphate synthase subunit PhnL
MIGVFHHPSDVKALIDRKLHLEAIKIEDEQDDVAE